MGFCEGFFAFLFYFPPLFFGFFQSTKHSIIYVIDILLHFTNLFVFQSLLCNLSSLFLLITIYNLLTAIDLLNYGMLIL